MFSFIIIVFVYAVVTPRSLSFIMCLISWWIALSDIRVMIRKQLPRMNWEGILIMILEPHIFVLFISFWAYFRVTFNMTSLGGTSCRITHSWCFILEKLVDRILNPYKVCHEKLDQLVHYSSQKVATKQDCHFMCN